MQKYLNKNGDSGVTHFVVGKDYIELKFKGEAAIYTYHYNLNGKAHIERMKALAVEGKGLAAYIARHPEVRDHFYKKEGR